MKGERTGAAIHWTFLALLTFTIVVLVSVGINALTRSDWGQAAMFLLVAAIVLVPRLVLSVWAWRNTKLSHPHPTSN